MKIKTWIKLIAGLMLAQQAAMAADLAPDTIPASTTPLILISIDGFRADYLQRGKSPVLEQLRQRGAYAKALIPSFPTLTFPNHYTLVTGLRPDHHGIVGNTMEDPDIADVRFSLGNKAAVSDRRWWDQAEPIWVSAEKQGLASATMFWPGSEAAIRGQRPRQWQAFDGKLSASSRVDTLLSWLDQPSKLRPNFLTLYFDDVDHAGHDYGPDSAEVNASLQSVDQALARLVTGLWQRQIVANLLIVSDHGMAATSADRLIYLNQLVPAGSISLLSYGAVASIKLAQPVAAQTVNSLLAQHPHMTCWRKHEIPARLDFGKNKRVSDIVCLAEPGWMIMAEAKPDAKIMAGTHGYDHQVPQMAALFIAAGPAFRQGVEIERLDNVDVYPLIMHILKLRPQSHQGNLTQTLPLLRESDKPSK